MSRHALAVAAVLLLCTTACDTPAPTAADAPQFDRSPSAPVHSVTGYGRLDLSDWGLPDETYMLNVQKDGHGRVRGTVQISLSEPMPISAELRGSFKQRSNPPRPGHRPAGIRRRLQ